MPITNKPNQAFKINLRANSNIPKLRHTVKDNTRTYTPRDIYEEQLDNYNTFNNLKTKSYAR